MKVYDFTKKKDLFFHEINRNENPAYGKDHVASFIDGKLYDINGILKPTQPYLNMTATDISLAETWSFHDNNLIQLTECPNCEEPLCFDPDKK